MVLVYLTSGECIEVQAAQGAHRVSHLLICMDANGRYIASFDSQDVVAFTANPETAELMVEEVCDDVTVVPA